jgi:transcription-repair coupling factor (superfamily II helicase)
MDRERIHLGAGQPRDSHRPPDFNRCWRVRAEAPKRRTTTVRTDGLQGGDYVVHVDYGIGRFVGLEKINAGDSATECLTVRF